MRCIKYDKLVRDKIPEIISNHKKIPITRILTKEEYQSELRKKLREEVDEFENSGKMEELADILEVVYALAASKGVSQNELNQIRKRKYSECGGFDQRTFLIETQE